MEAVWGVSAAVAVSAAAVGGPRDAVAVAVTDCHSSSSVISEAVARLDPGSLAASVMHAAAVVLGVHRRNEDGRCRGADCDEPCVIAEYAEQCQRLAMSSSDVRALLGADRWLAAWILLHVNDGGVR